MVHHVSTDVMHFNSKCKSPYRLIHFYFNNFLFPYINDAGWRWIFRIFPRRVTYADINYHISKHYSNNVAAVQQFTGDHAKPSPFTSKHSVGC